MSRTFRLTLKRVGITNYESMNAKGLASLCVSVLICIRPPQVGGGVKWAPLLQSDEMTQLLLHFFHVCQRWKQMSCANPSTSRWKLSLRPL